MTDVNARVQARIEAVEARRGRRREAAAEFREARRCGLVVRRRQRIAALERGAAVDRGGGAAQPSAPEGGGTG
ncbi:hypothetical protein ACFQLX_23725 [Streptomyces polyrhachis]|uniref:Uncharacterized protein n=1 Tax=Streptomyces polyrhachis TaxID=1282885 RepID=A0ABW2GNR0_9ACTN